MPQRKSIRRLIGSAVLLLAFGANLTRATTLNFSYSGRDVTGSGGSSAGIGSFSFSGAPILVSLADLTAFAFTQTTTLPVSPGTSSFTYSLSSLTSFSLSLSGGLPATFSLHTGLSPGDNPLFASESFTVTGLGPTGAFTGDPIGGPLQVGSVNFTPEPASAALIGIGLVTASLLARRGLRKTLP